MTRPRQAKCDFPALHYPIYFKQTLLLSFSVTVKLPVSFWVEKAAANSCSRNFQQHPLSVRPAEDPPVKKAKTPAPQEMAGGLVDLQIFRGWPYPSDPRSEELGSCLRVTTESFNMPLTSTCITQMNTESMKDSQWLSASLRGNGSPIASEETRLCGEAQIVM